MFASRRFFALILFISLAAVGAALYTQHVLDMQPCPWCVLQRLIFVVMAVFSLVGLAWPARAGTITSSIALLVLAACGSAAALWQHFVASQSNSCNQTLADRVVSGIGLDAWAPEIFAARASCADAATRLFGVAYEFWSLALFVLLAGLAVLALRHQGGHSSAA